VCYSAEDTTEGNLTIFPGCPASDGLPLAGASRPSIGRTTTSSGSYEIWVSLPPSCFTKKNKKKGGMEMVRFQTMYVTQIERIPPYLDGSRRFPVSVDLRYILNPSLDLGSIPSLLIASRYGLRGRCRPGPFDPSCPIRLSLTPPALTGSPSSRQRDRARMDPTTEGEEWNG